MLRFLPLLLLLGGCQTIDTKTHDDIVASQQVIYYAAQSLPVSPQTIAIEANAAATANALGTPMPMPGTPISPSTTAAAVKVTP